MKHKSLKNGYALLFIILGFVILTYFFDRSFGYILRLIGCALFYGTLFSLYNSFFNPSMRMYKSKYLLEGIGYGCFIGSVGVINNYSDHLLARIGVALAVGVLLAVAYHFWQKFRLKKKAYYEKSLLFEELAVLQSGNDDRTQGYAFVTNTHLCFYDKQKKTISFKKELAALSSTAVDDTIFHIPSAVHLTEDDLKLIIKFPLFWNDLINGEKIALRQ